MNKYLSYEELTIKEKEQATQSYKSIRAIEEGVFEDEVNISGIENCRFERDDDYIWVLI